MFEKFIIIYSFIITFNCAVEINETAEFEKSDKLFKKSINAATKAEDTWQPIIQTRYWLPKPTTFTNALSGATETLQQPFLKTKLSNNATEKHNSALNHRRNYIKQLVKSLKSTVKLTTQLVSPPTTKPFTYLKEDMQKESNFYSPINQNNNNAKVNHQQLVSLYYNKTETQYPQIQISKNVMHHMQENRNLPLFSGYAFSNNSSILSQLSHFNYLTDKAKHKELTHPSPSPSLAIWHYSPQAKHIATLQNATKNTFATMNFHGKIFKANNTITGNNLPTTLNSSFTNEPLTGNEISNIKMHQHQYHQLNSISENGTKYFRGDSKEEETVSMAKVATVGGSEEKFSEKLFNSSNYELSGSKIWSDNDNEDKFNVFSNDDSANDDIDLEMLTSSARQMVKATSEKITAAIADSLKNVASYDVQKRLFSLPPTAAATSLLYLRGKNGTHYQTERTQLKSTSTNEPQATAQLRNLSTKYKIASTVATLTKTPSFPLQIAPTSNSSTAVSSGRKIRRGKKKFRLILLPLLLAYKLKFMALIPLLAGGLVLLVGSTGLAGFFFALFTAVMSLKKY